VTLRLKYNIERKAKEKRRKARRFARLHPEMVMRESAARVGGKIDGLGEEAVAAAEMKKNAYESR
jgi:hypothetical protein